MVWKVSVNSGYGYFIPNESSAWKFKPLVLSEGSGENWIYGKDDRYYYYAGEGISPEEYIKTEKSISDCVGFNPVDYKSWCIARQSQNKLAPNSGNESSDNFCKDVVSGKNEGIFYTNIAQAQGTDWHDQYWCFKKDESSYMAQSMEEGVLGKLEQKSTPKTYYASIVEHIKSLNVHTAGKAETPEQDREYESRVGTCNLGHRIIVHTDSMSLNGWYIQSYCDPSDNPEHYTNLEGQYPKLFQYIESLMI